jgi:hypothetical protein
MKIKDNNKFYNVVEEELEMLLNDSGNVGNAAFN